VLQVALVDQAPVADKLFAGLAEQGFPKLVFGAQFLLPLFLDILG